VFNCKDQFRLPNGNAALLSVFLANLTLDWMRPSKRLWKMQSLQRAKCRNWSGSAEEQKSRCKQSELGQNWRGPLDMVRNQSGSTEVVLLYRMFVGWTVSLGRPFLERTGSLPYLR
jgi:hypothetical protein